MEEDFFAVDGGEAGEIDEEAAFGESGVLGEGAVGGGEVGARAEEVEEGGGLGFSDLGELVEVAAGFGADEVVAVARFDVDEANMLVVSGV